MSETRQAYNVAMQPGRELDALVAKVLGWQWVASKDPAEALSPFYRFIIPPDDPLPFQSHPAKGDEPLARNWDRLLFSYSENPMPALEAWEWLEKNLGPRYNLAFLVRTDKPSVCLCWHAYEPEMIIEGDTYPHAIALAVVEAGKGWVVLGDKETE